MEGEAGSSLSRILTIRPGIFAPGRPALSVSVFSTRVYPQPRLAPSDKDANVIEVPAYTDFRLHDICEPADQGYEPLDQNQPIWSPKFHCGNRRFLTTRLWGVANQPPYFHHGLFTTLRESVLAHHGEAEPSRDAFLRSSEYERDSLIEFLKTLQVLRPRTRSLIVDEKLHSRKWPPR
ncbi:MAG TPA: di-heme oxidoredictase family protein [Bryobacteraceae bacterium]|nr:di-heme oxidoredictase family protein [Bryobacteraceae bacterium]